MLRLILQRSFQVHPALLSRAFTVPATVQKPQEQAPKQPLAVLVQPPPPQKRTGILELIGKPRTGHGPSAELRGKIRDELPSFELEGVAEVTRACGDAGIMVTGVQKLVEREILRKFDQMTVPAYLNIITGFANRNPAAKLLSPLLEDTGKRNMRDLTDSQLTRLVWAYTRSLKATPEFYSAMSAEILRRIPSVPTALLAQTAEGLSRVQMAQPELFRRIEVAVMNNAHKFTPADLLKLETGFSTLRPKNSGLRKKILYNLIPQTASMEFQDCLQFLDLLKSHPSVWKSYMDQKMWENVQSTLETQLDHCDIDDCVKIARFARAANLHTESFIRRVLGRLETEPYGLSSLSSLCRAMEALVDFGCKNLAGYFSIVTGVLSDPAKQGLLTDDELIRMLGCFSDMGEKVPELPARMKTITTTELMKLSGEGIRAFIKVTAHADKLISATEKAGVVAPIEARRAQIEKLIGSLTSEKKSEALNCDPAMLVNAQERNRLAREVERYLQARGMDGLFQVESQVTDPYLNLIDVAVLRRDPSPAKLNNFAVVVLGKAHLMAHSPKQVYVDFDSKRKALERLDWKVVVMEESKLAAGEAHLEKLLAPVLKP